MKDTTSHRSQISKRELDALEEYLKNLMLLEEDVDPTTDLQAMADCLQPPLDIHVRRKQRSMKSPAPDPMKHVQGTEQTNKKTDVSAYDIMAKYEAESRQPSPARDPRQSSFKSTKRHTRQPQKAAWPRSGADVAAAVTSLSLSQDAPSGSRSFESNIIPFPSHPGDEIKTPSMGTSRRKVDLKMSKERLEALVMQLRETNDEKEAATIILEFALRIKNHELVVQGADLSIINAMKRFSNSHKIQTRGCKALMEMASKGPPYIEAIVDKGGSDSILTAMELHRAEEDLQKEACRAIDCIARDQKLGKQSFGENAKNAITSILHCMNDHPNAASLHRMACRALATIASGSAQCSQTIVSRGGLDAIRRTLKHHDDNMVVTEHAFDVLFNIASAVNEVSVAEEVAMTVSMDRVLTTLLLYRDQEKIQSKGMALLCILCKSSPRNRAKMASMYCLEVVFKSLENCIANKDVQRHGMTMIQYLTMSEGNAVAAGLATEGGMEILLSVLRRHGSDPVIVQHVSLIVAKMARPFSDIVRKEGGIELILAGMRRHEESIIVQEAAIMALWKLSAKTENANVINGNGGVTLINAALSRFSTDATIAEVACEALASLSHDKQLLLAQETLRARAANATPEKQSSWCNCGVGCF
jgi:hypothetical protein